MDSHQPWQMLLRAPEPSDHVIQLYTDAGFLTRAVAQFIGAGLEQHEGGVVVATPSHIDAIVRALGARLDVKAAQARGQLVTVDARRMLDSFMVDGRPHRRKFFAAVRGILDRVTTTGYPMMRLFGEMVDLLWDQNLPATVELEQLWNEVLTARRAALLCAYRIDNFDRRVHRGVLHQLTRCHSHLVPVEDYARLGRAVDAAYRDVFGRDSESDLLRRRLGRRPDGAVMPPAEAALLALREVHGDAADELLERARRHYGCQ